MNDFEFNLIISSIFIAIGTVICSKRKTELSCFVLGYFGLWVLIEMVLAGFNVHPALNEDKTHLIPYLFIALIYQFLSLSFLHHIKPTPHISLISIGFLFVTLGVNIITELFGIVELSYYVFHISLIAWTALLFEGYRHDGNRVNYSDTHAVHYDERHHANSQNIK